MTKSAPPNGSEAARALIISALRDLSDVQFQTRVWVSGSNSEMSSLSEVVSALYDDSGLADKLDQNRTVFSSAIDDELRKLDDYLRPFVILSCKMSGDEVGDLIQTPEWTRVVDLANELLAKINKLP